MKNNKRLYTHMVLIPLGRKLVVLNFYHSSLQLLKHMTNIREKMLETLSLPKIEALGGILPGEIPDELTVAVNNEFGEIDSVKEPAFEGSDDITITPDAPEPATGTDTAFEASPAPDVPAGEDDTLQPDSFTDGGDSDYPEPPPAMDDAGDDVPPPPEPPADDAVTPDEDVPAPPAGDETPVPSDDEVPAPPGDEAPANEDPGAGNVDDDDYYPGPSDGGDVSF